VPRKTTENTVKHRSGGVGSVVANHRGGGEISMVVTTLGFPYSIPSVGPGADPGVQAVSLQVTVKSSTRR